MSKYKRRILEHISFFICFLFFSCSEHGYSTSHDIPKNNKYSHHLKVLCIGNSFNSDAIAYVPIIMKELLPEYSLVFGALYESSASLAKHIEMYNDNIPYRKFSYWGEDDNSWTRYTSSHTLVDALNLEDWDVITIQGTTENLANQSSMEKMISDAKDLKGIIQEIVKKPVSIMWYEWISRITNLSDPPRTAADMDADILYNYGRIQAATQLVKDQLAVADIIPVGTAFQNARTVATFNALGTTVSSISGVDRNMFGRMLYKDAVHMNAGIPSLIAAYTTCLKLLEWTGNIDVGLNGTSFIPTNINCSAIRAGSGASDPLTHGYSVGVEDRKGNIHYKNIELAKKVATIAVKYPFLVTDMNEASQVSPKTLMKKSESVWYSVDGRSFGSKPSKGGIYVKKTDGHKSINIK